MHSALQRISLTVSMLSPTGYRQDTNIGPPAHCSH